MAPIFSIEEIKSPEGMRQLPPSGSLTPEVTVRNLGSEAASFYVAYHLESYDGAVTYDDDVWVEGLASGGGNRCCISARTR